MKTLLIPLLLLIGLPAFGQSTWRNWYTTNQNPIIDIVAGSNATVQASVVPPNLRRWTVNAVPTSGQTNNTVVAALTNIVVVTNVSSGTTLYSIGGIPQTNISVLGITNGGYLTNWALVPTNYIPISSGFVTNATLTNHVYASNIVSGGQITVSALATNSPLTNQVLTSTSATTTSWRDAPIVLYRNTTVVNDTGSSAASNVVSFTIPASFMATNRIISVKVNGDYLQNTATATNLTLSIKYGSTTMWASTVAITTSANRRPFVWAMDIYNVNSASVQSLNGLFSMYVAGAATTGTGPLAQAPANPMLASFEGTAAENSATDLTFLCIAQWQSIAATCEFKVQSVIAILQ